MKLKLIFTFLLIVSTIVGNAKAQGPKEFIYKQIDSTSLRMFVYSPDDLSKSSRCNAIVFFFGGGWAAGSTAQFEPFAKYYASKGFVSILVDYRVRSRHGTTPLESLKDAKSAIRYIRANSKLLHIHPDKIVTSGGSAGGHLAAACYTNANINETSDDLSVSSKPNALVLLNPVIDNSEEGYGYERLKENWKDFSPLHNISKGFPPTIFFLGTNDKLIPVSTAQLFKQKIESVSGRCDLVLYENQKHGFFKQNEFYNDIIIKVDAFFKSLGYMK